MPQIDYAVLYARIQEIESTPVENLLDVQYQQGAITELLPLIQQAEILAGKYEILSCKLIQCFPNHNRKTPWNQALWKVA